MLKKIALAFTMLFALAMVGCQNMGQMTPEKAIVHAIAANKVLAQCYADYQAELDAKTAQSIEAANGLTPVVVPDAALEADAVPVPTPQTAVEPAQP